MKHLTKRVQATTVGRMRRVNLSEARTYLSALVEEAAAGEDIIIAKNGKARARLTSIVDQPRRRSREFGFWKHYGWKLPDNFDDPDPEIEALFYGHTPTMK